MNANEPTDAAEPKEGDASRCQVVIAPAGGWNVIVERSQRPMSVTHCDDWHRVERLRAAFDRATAG
jgi:hypothetical protein